MIKINNLRKEYGDFSLDVSMDVKKGNITGLIGRNGAGKSTTIKAVLGLIKPDGGNITVTGKDSSHLRASDKENIGVLLSDAGFSKELSIEDVIKINRQMYQSFDEDFFRSNCLKQNLPLNKMIKEFSRGMQVKLCVLCTMSHNAKLLILDEPTSGLDVIARNEILDMLRGYMEGDSERSILISSHISSDLEGLCDDIYMIHDGKILLHEDTDTILSNYGIIKVNESDYDRLEGQYIKAAKKESFGYACLTCEKQYFIDNYPDIVVENGNIDSVIVFLGGEDILWRK